MVTAFLVIIFIGIICLTTILLLRRWKGISQHETINTVFGFIEVWGLFFLGAIGIPTISQTQRIIMIILDTLIVGLFCGGYFYWKRPKEPKTQAQPLVKKTRKRRSDEIHIRIKKATINDILFWLLIVIEFLDFFLLDIWIPETSWQTLTIDHVPVLTYANFSIIVFFLIGLVLVWDIARRFKLKWLSRHTEGSGNLSSESFGC